MPHCDEARGLLSSVVLQNATLVATATHAATSKATPVDADELPLVDSAASFGLKKLTWANLKATLATWINANLIPASFTTVVASQGVTTGASGGTDGIVTLKRASDGLTVGTVSVDSTNSQLDVTTAYSYIQLNTDTGQKALLGPSGLQVFSAASPPTYVKGAMYFDTTLNKLRIGGATAWETVTSV